MWQSLLRWATSGTPVFVMDLMRPATLEDVDRLVAEHSTDEPEILRRDFHASLLAAYRVTEAEEQLAGAGLERLTVRAVTDRHLTVQGRMP